MSDEARIPLGELEDHHLEFKAAAVLDSPEKVGREVVGMLNADGGQVWIGLREEEGRAVALDLIPDVERARDRLFDSLLDSLSPQPDHQEVQVKVVVLPDGGNEGLLLVSVQPKEERRPYASMSGARYSFNVRVGSRLRAMSREEIFSDGGQGEGQVLREARQTIGQELRTIAASAEPRLWVRLQPVPELVIDPEDKLFLQLASDPGRSGNRRLRSFATSRNEPAVHLDRVGWGRGDSLRVSFHADGGAAFFLALHLVTLRDSSEEFTELDPLRLAEYTVSAFRIGRAVYDSVGMATGTQVLAALALLGQDRLLLRPGSPGPFFSFGDPWELQESDATAGLRFSAAEFLDNPDYCGFRLLGRIYQAFGLREENMPSEFDRKTGRLILPE